MTVGRTLVDLPGHVSASRSLVRLARTYRYLLVELAVRDVRDRFAGHVLGVVWTIAHPILLMGIYVGIFTFVFPARGLTAPGRTQDLTVYILAGLIPWLCFQEVLARSTTAITGNASLVKQIVFPVELLPIKTVLGCLPTQLVATAFLVGLALLTGLGSPALLLFPVVLILQVAAMLGVAFALSAVGAFVRDLRELVVVFCAVNLFLQPILYAPAQLPRVLRPVLWLNPFSHLVWVAQDVFFFGAITHPVSWVVLTVGALVTLGLGYRLFRGLKHRFGDML